MDRLNMSLDDLVKSNRPTDKKNSGDKRGDKKKVVKSGGARSVQKRVCCAAQLRVRDAILF